MQLPSGMAASLKPNLLPSPVELGFPVKFQDWYPDQLLAIDKAVFNTKRFTALGMPTGSGKSVTGVATALLHQEVKRAIYLTSTKGLQDQLSSDFHELGLYDVRGQRNYPCDALAPGGRLDRYRRGRFSPGCDEGPCHSGVRCEMAPDRKEPNIRPACKYYGAVWDARRAEIVSTNYAMYLTSTTYAEGLGQFDLLILDEAHDADKELESFLTTEITVEDARYLGTKMLQVGDVGPWVDWAIHHHSELQQKVAARQAMVPNDIEGVREMRTLVRLLGKLTHLKAIDPLDWVVELDAGKIAKFSPMKVSRYAEEYLFRGIKHVLLMSATMTRKTTQLLGINADHLHFWECPSRFALERRPIVCVNTTPSVRVDMRMHDSTKHSWLRRIDRLIEPRRELKRNGIIHTVSYQRMRDLIATSEHKDIMMVHDQANTREVIQAFKKLPGTGRILVSPSVVTGYDFPDDECRYQIIGKVPMPDSRGAIMKVRQDLDKEYTGYLAMQKLVQACGRGMRGPYDWCETFVIDDHFSDWFLRRYGKHAPVWFKDAVEYSDTFPEPLDETLLD